MKASRLFKEFTQSEKSGGIILLFCTMLSLFLANSPIGVGYVEFWNEPMFGHPASHWINDGLMTIFFLLVGLELERDIYIGELSKLRNAMLPIVAALGGMLVPAVLTLLLIMERQPNRVQASPWQPTLLLPLAFSRCWVIKCHSRSKFF